MTNLIKPKKVSFPTSDGLEAHGLLYAIEDEDGKIENAPLIVNIHGGPTGMVRNQFTTSPQYFATRGYVFFELNYRGSIGYGRDYRQKLKSRAIR